MKYSERLKDPRWQKMRLKIMERDEWTCRMCGDSTSTLHVHHTVYNRRKAPWEVPANTLVTLCENCHSIAHQYVCVMVRTRCGEFEAIPCVSAMKVGELLQPLEDSLSGPLGCPVRDDIFCKKGRQFCSGYSGVMRPKYKPHGLRVFYIACSHAIPTAGAK